MLRNIIGSFIVLSLLSIAAIFGQRPSAPSVETVSIEELVKKAGLRRSEYIEAFKDLNAQEIQRVEEYDDNGLKRRREIVSDLIVYESPLSKLSAVEYRNIRLVDGKPVGGREHRAEQLFARLLKASSLKKELERINDESRRFDLGTSFYGFTLNQGLPLDETVSRHYRFTLYGREQIDGHEVLRIDYQQISPMAEMVYNLTLPDKLKGAEPLYRGRLWLDRDTLRLRREERELTINHPSLNSPLTFVRFEFKYADSRFEILTPTHINITTFSRGHQKADGSPELFTGGKVEFEYGSFSRFEVTPDFRPGL